MAAASGHRTGRRTPREHAVIAAAVSFLLFAEALIFGGNATDLALAFAGLWFVGLAVLLSRPFALPALSQLRLTWVGAAFVAVILAGLSSLTPFAPGGPNPVWTWVIGARPATTLDPYLSIAELVKLTGLGAVFLVGVLVGADDERAKTMVRWLLGVGLAYSMWAIIDHVANPNELFGAPRAFGGDRLSASLGSANTAATFFGALALINLVELDRQFRNHKPSGKLDLRRLERLAPKVALPMTGLATAAASLILTLSRGGISATLAVTVVLVGGGLVMRAKRNAITGPALATAVVVVGLVLASFAMNLGALQDRLTFLAGDRLIREAIFAAHRSAFEAAPWSGSGLGSFPRINGMIMSQSNLSALDMLGATHNVYIQWLEQAGLIGAAPMFICIGLIVLKILGGVRRRRRMRGFLVGVLGVLAVVLIHGASDFALEVPAMTVLVSLLLGLACGVSGPAPGVASLGGGAERASAGDTGSGGGSRRAGTADAGAVS